MELFELSLYDAAELIKAKEITSQELTRALLDRIDKLDGKIGSFLTVDEAGAMAQARALRRATTFQLGRY